MQYMKPSAQQILTDLHACKAARAITNEMLIDEPYSSEEIRELLREYYPPFAHLRDRTLQTYAYVVIDWLRENKDIDGEPYMKKMGHKYLLVSSQWYEGEC